MQMISKLILLFLFNVLLIDAFLFGSSAGCGCSQPPSCPPPPPPTPCGNRVYARGAKTMTFNQPINQDPPRVINVPDELDLRAAAYGVPLVPQEPYSVFDILHNLGEKNGNRDFLNAADGTARTDYYPTDNDEDLTISESTGGLRGGKEIRRAPVEPTIRVDVETTTVSNGEKRVDTEDDKIDSNKCSSNVLRKLMLENMSDSSAESKKNVNTAAEAKFGGNVDVICSRGHFSYIFTSNLFCEASKGLTTCIAFRQTEKNRRRR